jgi:XisH protein
MIDSDRVLYLAVPEDTFDSFFQERFVQEALKLYQLRLLVYDSHKGSLCYGKISLLSAVCSESSTATCGPGWLGAGNTESGGD